MENKAFAAAATRRLPLACRALCVLLSLCCALSFAACGGGDESRSIIMAAPPQSGTAPSQASSVSSEAEEAAPAVVAEDVAMELRTVSHNLSGAYAGNNTGCYMPATFADGSADIFWFDYESLSMTLLDNPANTRESLRGHLWDCWGGITPLASDGYLFVFRLGGSPSLVQSYGEAGHAAVMRLEADASAPSILTFPDSWSFHLTSAVLSDGQSLYFMMTEPSGDGTDTLLVQFNFVDMEYRELYRFEAGYEYSIEGSWAMGPVICAAESLPAVNDPGFTDAWNERQFILFNHGMNSGERQSLFVWQQGLPTNMQDGLFYYWSAEEGAVRRLDVNTGEDVSLASGFAPDKYVTMQFLRTVQDGRLRLQFSFARSIEDYSLTLATGEIAKVPVNSIGTQVTICAEGPEHFLVRNGERWVARDKVPYSFIPGTESSPSTPGYVSMAEYALITKADYWAGNSAFIKITDTVFK